MGEAYEINRGNFDSNVKFLDIIILSSDNKILEIGSGNGSVLNYLYKKGYDIRGVEIDRKKIKRCNKLFGNLPITEMSGDRLEYENSKFDVILSFDVFEHIKDTDKHLDEVKRVLRPEGYYLLQTPNKITNIPWSILLTKSFNYKK